MLKYLFVGVCLCVVACAWKHNAGPAAAVSVAPERFSWVQPQVLAGMAHPGTGPQLDKTVDFLRSQGIFTVVSLTEETPFSAPFEQMRFVHMPVVDYTAPTLAQLKSFVAIVQEESSKGRPVVVHCRAGLGRTGTFLAAWFVSQGMSSQAAMDKVRLMRPGSVETALQEDAVRMFEKSK